MTYVPGDLGPIGGAMVVMLVMLVFGLLLIAGVKKFVRYALHRVRR